MKIIKERTLENIVSYKKEYGDSEKESLYFSFDCDENGNINLDLLHEDAIKNLKEIEQGIKFINGIKIELLGVKRYEQDVFYDAVGICEVCEDKVTLSDPMTNTCDCGAEYNRSGQRLEHRSLWDGTDGATSPDYE